MVVILTAGIWLVSGDDPEGGSGTPVPYSSPETFDPPFLYLNVPPAPEGLPACPGEQIEVEDVRAHPGPPDTPGGGATYAFVFTNAGAACAMTGAPEMTLVSPSGTAEPLAPKPGGRASFVGKTISQLPNTWQLEADQDVYVDLSLSGIYCEHFTDPTLQVWFGPQDSGLPAIDVPEPQCPTLAVAGNTLYTTVWTPYFPPDPPPQPSRLDGAGLTASVAAPATIPQGTATIDYTVTLANPTNTDIALRPCPRYREAAGDDSLVEEAYEVLNCAEAPSAVPAGGSITFEMSIPLADGLRAGRHISLLWNVYPIESDVGDYQDITVIG